MNFKQKLSAALELLSSTGIWRCNYAPPIFHLLWKLGARVPPPHFVGFKAIFVFNGSFFGIAWGLLMWSAFWSRKNISLGYAVGVATLAGILFGLLMAFYYRYGAHKHGIPKWRDFHPIDE